MISICLKINEKTLTLKREKNWLLVRQVCCEKRPVNGLLPYWFLSQLISNTVCCKEQKNSLTRNDSKCTNNLSTYLRCFKVIWNFLITEFLSREANPESSSSSSRTVQTWKFFHRIKFFRDFPPISTCQYYRVWHMS